MNKLNEELKHIKKLMGVNENTAPIVLYHGSNTQITNFVDDFVGRKDATDQEGPGIYFTTSEEDAHGYGEYIHKVILRPRKLLSETSGGANKLTLIKLAKMAPEWVETAQNWNERNPEKGLIQAIDDIYLYNETEKDRFQSVWYDFYKKYEEEEDEGAGSKKYVRNCVELGYDGMVVNRNNGVKHYIVYNPAIIEKVG